MKETIQITGMNCEHCVAKVEKAVGELNGVDKIKVKLKKEEAKIKYDDTLVSSDDIKQAIRDLGYTAN